MPRPTTGTSLARARSDTTTREIIEMAGGRDALEEALELTGANPQGAEPFDVLLSRMRDPSPQFTGQSLTQLAAGAGINRLQLFELIGRRDAALAVFLSRRKHLADVLDDIGEDAKTTIVKCRNCEGKGIVDGQMSAADRRDAEALAGSGIDLELQPPEEQDCDDCNGTGRLRKLGDAESRKMFLKVHGFDKGAGGGPSINSINVGVQVRNDGGGMNKPEPVTIKVERLLDGG